MFKKKILVVCPYPLRSAPGQRFRVELYENALRESGFDVHYESFLSPYAYSVIYKDGHFLKKFVITLLGFLNRLLLSFSILRFDRILLFREASPVGPPVFEAIMFLFRRNVDYDFDDAIYLKQTASANQLINEFKWPSKVGYIAKNARCICVSNNFLAAWARQHNPNVLVVPTSVDVNYHRRPARPKVTPRKTIIGWTGSHSTARYLDLVRPILAALDKKYQFEFRVICDVDPMFSELCHYTFVPWRIESEISDLSEFDIGIMPIPDGQWESGKAGFKAIQYSALEIIPVVSKTGVGSEVVLDGVTGLVVENSPGSWEAALASLLETPDRTTAMQQAARAHVEAHYSSQANQEKIVAMFK